MGVSEKTKPHVDIMAFCLDKGFIDTTYSSLCLLGMIGQESIYYILGRYNLPQDP